MKKLALTLALGAFAVSPALADADAGVKDLDGDGMISKSEYQAANQGKSSYKLWDKNDDGAIDNTEAGQAAAMNDRLLSYDADGDGTVTVEEFDEGEFSFYDTDADGSLNETESAALNQARINEQSTPSE